MSHRPVYKAPSWRRFNLDEADQHVSYNEVREPEVAYNYNQEDFIIMKTPAVMNNSEALNQNCQKAEAFGEHFFHLLNEEMMIPCSNAFMRIKAEDYFELIFIVEPQKYSSKDFLKVYERSLMERGKINNDQFYLSVMFMPEVAHLDKTKIVRDGYFNYYDGYKA